MRQLRWMMALVLGAFVLAACGTLQTETADATIEAAALRAPDETIDPSNDDFEAMRTAAYWIEYGLTTYGETWVCWMIAPNPSAEDFELVYTPPGYTWLLGVVTKGDAHYLFEDPVEGDVFETGGYDQVIACKIADSEEDTGALLVLKKDAAYNYLAGAVFTITPIDVVMNEIELGVHCVAGLTIQEYTVTETTPPAGYTADDAPKTMTPVAGTDCMDNRPSEQPIFRNTPVPGKVKVYKTDAYDEPFAGVTFRLMDGDAYDETCITDAAGYCGFYAVPLGEYTLDEELPMGYTLGTVMLDGDVLPHGLPHAFTIGLGDAPDTGQTFIFEVENVAEGGEWCSPGFWRNSPIAASEAAAAGGFAMSDPYEGFFDPIEGINERQRVRLGLPLSPTLTQVLDYPQVYGGEAFNNVGDLLSGAHPDVDFDGNRYEGSCPLPADASRR